MTVANEHPNLLIAGRPCRNWAMLYLEGQRPGEEASPENCGIFSEPVCYLAVYAALYNSNSHAMALASLVDKLIESSINPAVPPQATNWEYCRGFAGVLYLLRLVKTWYAAARDTMDLSIHRVIEHILANGPPWVFMDSFTLLGPGHGDIGIALQIVRSNPSYAEHNVVRNVVLHILDEQLGNGNWPTSASDAVFRDGSLRSRGERQLVQWCHGAPGIAQCLVLLRPYFPKYADRMTKAIEKARELTWKEGLIVKEPNLCHGITGNAFTFPPGPQRNHFLAFTTENEVRMGLENGIFERCDYGLSHSLGFGFPGRAVGWLWKTRDAEKELRGCYLAFDDI